jgi:probable HAF family extracellular repeat protein
VHLPAIQTGIVIQGGAGFQQVETCALPGCGGGPFYGTVSHLGTNAGNTITVLASDFGTAFTAIGWGDTDADTFHAISWTLAGGTQDLGTLLGSAGLSIGFGVSYDASTVVGWSNTTPGSPFPSGQHAFRWTQGGGMQDLGSLQGASGTSTAYAANSDGSVVVGVTDLPPNGQITVPGHAFRWTQAGGMQDLGSLGAGLGSGATAVSADGSVVVGFGAVSGGGTHAFRWTQSGGMQDLGAISGLKWTTATSVSSDGNIVVGYGDPTVAEIGSTGWTLSSNSRPFVWTQATGTQDLNALLSSAGIDMTGVTLMTAFGVSHDGPFIMGGGTFSDTPGGSISFYLARICSGPDSGACTRLALPGTHDFNANGFSDIAWRDTSGNTAIWEMNGTTVTDQNSSFVANVAGQWAIVGQRDFNGDGYADMLWHDTSGNVAIWEMNGTRVLNANSSFVAKVPTNWSILGTGDFNGDTKGDILWQDMSGNVAIWEMNGTTVLNQNSSFVANVPSQWAIKGTGDFNGDGKTDILWQDTSGNVAIWEMNGTAILNQNSSFVAHVPSQWSIKGTGDFNGDGKTDILWRDTSGNAAIWEMNGTTVLNQNSSFVANVAGRWSILLTGDFNGDGMSDILWQDTSGNLAIWEMNGTAVLNQNSSFVANVPGQWSVQHLSAD